MGMKKIDKLKQVCLPKEEFVLPDQLEKLTPAKIKDIEYIIVGDNPGEEEHLLNRYFIGNNTNYIRNFFKTIYGENYEKYVLFLNKTPVYTKRTDLLKGHRGLGTQEKMAELIIDIEKRKPVPVWIMGHSHLKDLFKIFWSKIKNMNNLFVFNHPSRTHFLRDVEKAFGGGRKITKDEFCHFSPKECEKVLKELQREGLKLGHKEKY